MIDSKISNKRISKDRVECRDEFVGTRNNAFGVGAGPYSLAKFLFSNGASAAGGGTKLKLRTIPKYKKQDTNKLQIPSTKFQTIDDRPQSWQSNRAASELTRQQYEAKFRGATGQQHNLPNP